MALVIGLFDMPSFLIGKSLKMELLMVLFAIEFIAMLFHPVTQMTGFFI